MHRSELGAWDKQTDGRTTALLCSPLAHGGTKTLTGGKRGAVEPPFTYYIAQKSYFVDHPPTHPPCVTLYNISLTNP